MKHFFFDMDGTICESRQVIYDDVRDKLMDLMDLKKHIIVISGAEEGRMYEQLDGLDVDYVMSQSGAVCPFWDIKLTDEERLEVLAHLMRVKFLYPIYFTKDKEEDLLQDRGAQMTFSFLGHHADISDKRRFDPHGMLRKHVLKEAPFTSKKLECRIAGTTCFDYTYKNSTKGKNIRKLIKRLNWNPNDCVFFGDSLFKGGNDETVKGIIETVEVTDPYDMMVKLDKYM